MQIRVETLLNLVIVLILAVDAFVALQVYQQSSLQPEPLLPLAAARAEAEVNGPPTAGNGTPSGAEVVSTANRVTARNAVQSAVVAAQLAFVDDGVMPADSFAMQQAVPGARFVDGIARAATGVIGVERTDTTVLFVTAEADDLWLCAAVDGTAETTGYGSGSTREAVSDPGNCQGTQDVWG